MTFGGGATTSRGTSRRPHGTCSVGRVRVRILGAGIIGLVCADELSRRGHEVELVDPAPGSGASSVAAGLLSPSTDTGPSEDAAFRLGRRSAALWPELADRLGVPLTAGGTLLVAATPGDRHELERRVTVLRQRGCAVKLLDPDRVRRLEPLLTGRLAGGVLLDDRSVDPRAVVRALLARLPVVPAPSGRPVDVTLLATGCRLPAPYRHLVRPVRGEVVRAHSDQPPTRPLHGWVAGRSVYVVPRANGDLVIGATSAEVEAPGEEAADEEGAGEVPVTLGGVHELLDSASALAPGLARATWLGTVAGHRPASPDGLPLIGPTADPGTLLAAGHFRDGILLAPVTAALVADHLETGAVEAVVDPRRFGDHSANQGNVIRGGRDGNHPV